MWCKVCTLKIIHKQQQVVMSPQNIMLGCSESTSVIVLSAYEVIIPLRISGLLSLHQDSKVEYQTRKIRLFLCEGEVCWRDTGKEGCSCVWFGEKHCRRQNKGNTWVTQTQKGKQDVNTLSLFGKLHNSMQTVEGVTELEVTTSSFCFKFTNFVLQQNNAF